MKEKYPELILFIECGYRYRFFGRDAEIAASVLEIMCHRERMFITASVPTFNGPGEIILFCNSGDNCEFKNNNLHAI